MLLVTLCLESTRNTFFLRNYVIIYHQIFYYYLLLFIRFNTDWVPNKSIFNIYLFYGKRIYKNSDPIGNPWKKFL